jgi:hypothetical protein
VLVLVVAAGCSDPRVTLPYPTIDGEQTLIFFTVAAERTEAFAIDLDDRPRSLELPATFVEGRSGSIHALGFRLSLEELGLEEGPIQSAPDPSNALAPDSIASASFDGDGLSTWAPTSMLPGELQRFRLPLEDACTRFLSRRLPELDGVVPIGAVTVRDDAAVIVDGRRVYEIGPNGEVLGNAVAPDDIDSIALGASGVWIASRRLIARVRLDPLAVEPVATGSIAEKNVKWLAVGPGDPPELYALTGGGVFGRILPRPSRTLQELEFDGNDLGNGGVVAFGIGDAAAVYSGAGLVFRWIEGQIVRAVPDRMVVGFDAALLEGDRALLLESPNGDLIHFDGDDFERYPVRGVATVNGYVPFRGHYVAVTDFGDVFEYTEGKACSFNPDQSFQRILTITGIGESLLIGGIDSQQFYNWYLLTPES